jgi:ribosome biogenesis GTPase
MPGRDRRVGKISEKYNRGCHTTVLAHLEEWDDGELIDTPGVREFELYGITADELRFLFEEFASPAEKCAYPRCTHTHEPACAVKRAAESGEILQDRYESYLRIRDVLARREGRTP